MPYREEPPPDLEITQRLREWQAGDDEAIAEVLPHFYDRLRRYAARLMQSERREHTLEATALVHEAYLRLARLRKHEWRDRSQFFVSCAYLMRHTLVDHARRRSAQRRGGDQHQTALPDALSSPLNDVETIIAVDEALHELEDIDPTLAELATLRYFGGLSLHEIADLTDISDSTAKRRWWLARAYLRSNLEQSPTDE